MRPDHSRIRIRHARATGISITKSKVSITKSLLLLKLNHASINHGIENIPLEERHATACPRGSLKKDKENHAELYTR
jgi:hypothetical protein